MRFLLAPVALLCTAIPAAAQTIDMTKWVVEDFGGTGVWTTTPLFAEFVNNSIYDTSVLYSDIPLALVEFDLEVATAADDDFIGFVLGFQPGDAKNPNADYLIVDWKQITQTYADWGTAQAGLAISRMKGVGTVSTTAPPGIIDLWSHTLNCTELARGTNFGTVGWADNTKYRFRVIFTTGSVDIWVNGKQEFKLTGQFGAGRFGAYNLSQTNMRMSFPTAGLFKAVGKGCAGTGGTPFMFSPRPPILGQDLIAVVANMPPSGVASFLFGISDKQWGAVPLPFDLGLLGAPGCTLYNSAEVFLPIANFNGTGVILLPIPNDPKLAQFKFYCQASVTDPTTNQLGLVVSNSAEVVIGQ